MDHADSQTVVMIVMICANDYATISNPYKEPAKVLPARPPGLRALAPPGAPADGNFVFPFSIKAAWIAHRFLDGLRSGGGRLTKASCVL